MGFQVHLGFDANDYCISTQEHSGTLHFTEKRERPIRSELKSFAAHKIEVKHSAENGSRNHYTVDDIRINL
jgi:hypothetical protein